MECGSIRFSHNINMTLANSNFSNNNSKSNGGAM